MMENWKPIKGYEGIYEVSDLGRVRSLDRQVDNGHGSTRIAKGRIMKPHKHYNGYCSIGLSNDAIVTHVLIHRLVALAFVSGYHEGMEVNHIDENKQNNRADNLEWISRKENLHYGGHIKRSMSWISENVPKGCIQMTKEGKDIQKFDSIKKAAESIGVSRSLVSLVCRGKRKFAGGFRWRYAENSLNP